MSTWKCTLRGREFYSSDLTFGDADDIVGFVSGGNGAGSWLAANPYVAPRNAIGVLAVLLRKVEPDLSFTDAVTKARAIGHEAPAVFEVVEQDDSPTTYTDGIPDPR